MFYIFVLGLEQEKYYVSITDMITFGIDNFDHEQTVWTRIYKPIKMIEFLSGNQLQDIDDVVLRYMSRYGTENVRGGKFSELNLSKQDVELGLEKIKNVWYCLYCEEEFKIKIENYLHQNVCKIKNDKQFKNKDLLIRNRKHKNFTYRHKQRHAYEA